MRDRLLLFVRTYLLFVLLFVLGKPLFMLYNYGLYGSFGFGEWLRVMWHGLPQDLSTAGYLTLLPGLLLIASLWLRPLWVRRALRGYYGAVALLLALIVVADMGLYGYWGIRLDTTPLFYLSSPAEALAAAGWGPALLGVLAVGVLGALFYFLFDRLLVRALRDGDPGRGRGWMALALFVLDGALFLPIRGGLSASTMNAGKVFFSDRIELNHAALNPAFNLFESLTNNEDFSRKYRFMEADRAAGVFARLTDRPVAPADSLPRLLRTGRPNVVLVILESFTAEAVGALGGAPDATPTLNRLYDEGVGFTNFYANSFRTDRGLTAILSGYPAQPTASVMKFAAKTQSLPSIMRSLRDAGYTTEYFYGGDADFTNMRSYLLGQGIGRLVSQDDFTAAERSAQWGVPDHLLFSRVIDGLGTPQPGPFLKIVQTSSSHEPFDVPSRRFDDPFLNSVWYADSCVNALLGGLHDAGLWDNTLVVLVADHAVTYFGRTNYDDMRFRIPLLMTGGAVTAPAKVDAYGSQIDLAATLLGQMGIPAGEFRFSKNMLNPASPHFAFYDFPDGFGVAVPGARLVYDCAAGRVMVAEGATGAAADSLLAAGQAMLQTLYDDLAAR
ncbi:MAG: sulfatase-like hydrolase/transferase [Rikenellaceae bacterium]|nr:sulfatase-like hydrolase/transferase [Rikenellaceae bacterium]